MPKRTDSELPLLAPRLPQQRADRRGSRPDSMTQLFDRIRRGDKERRSFRERRATPRVALGLSLETNHGDGVLRLTTHDLSTFGLSIAQGPTPSRGQRLALRLFLPDDPHPLELTAEVIGPFDAKGGVRLRFLKPSIDAVRRIHRLLG